MKDIIIIGSGPAGMTAALYAGRAELNALMIEKDYQGGQMVTTNEVENYPGIIDITGPDLSNVMYEHAKKFGTEMIFEEVLDIQVDGDIKKVITNKATYETKVVILSMGAKPRNLGIAREQELGGRGISYCAICDGGFYRNKVVAVVGGGDTALEDALYLSRIAKKVYLIHRRDSFRGNKNLQKKIFESNIEIIWDSTVTELHGDNKLTGIQIVNLKDESIKDLELDGLFVAVGSYPMSNLVKDLVELNPQGYIIAGENCATSVDGIFAVGDIRTKHLRQVITAAADGAVSVYEAEKYLLNH